MGNTRIPFEPNIIYHVYNHGNADDIIFREHKNYDFFLKRYRKYITHIGETYAYCLMPNHFHILLKINDKDALQNFFAIKYPNRDPQSFGNFADLISNQFKNFLISYSKSFNKMYDRRGSLFLDNLKREKVDQDAYFTQLVRYIHLNPIKHEFAKKPGQWTHSSYNSYLSSKSTLLKRKQVLNWFGGRKNFIQSHRAKPDSF